MGAFAFMKMYYNFKSNIFPKNVKKEFFLWIVFLKIVAEKVVCKAKQIKDIFSAKSCISDY